MSYTEYTAPASTRASIACIWTVDGGRPDAAVPEERIIPDGCAEIIVQIGDPMRRVAADGGTIDDQPRAFLAGALSEGWALRPKGRVATIGIRLRAHAVGSIVGDSAEKFSDRATPLDLVFGKRAVEYVDALLSTDDETKRLAIAERFAVDIERGKRRSCERTRRFAQAVLESHGRRSIGEIADAFGVTARTLERGFREGIGIPAKTLARIARFQALLERLRSGRPGSFSEIAAAVGYFDQAHLVRDFKIFAGRTPRQFVADEGLFAACFSNPKIAAGLA